MRRIVLILAILIIFILSGLGGIYYYSTFVSSDNQGINNTNNQQGEVLNSNQNTNQEALQEVNEEVFQTKLFNIMLPSNWVFEEKQGIDSYVGEFRGDGITLFFDYGWYSGDPSQGDSSYQVTQKNIGGFSAKLFSSLANQDAGVYFGNLENKNKLTIYGKDLSAAEQEVVLQFFDSIKFIKKQTTTATQTCQNLSYGYELTYPADWRIWSEASSEGIIINCQAGASSMTFAVSNETFSSVLPYITINVLNQQNRIGSEYESVNSLNDYAFLIQDQDFSRQTINNQDLIFQDNTIVTFNNESLFFVEHNLPAEVIFNAINNNFKFIEAQDVTSQEKEIKDQEQRAAKILADVKQIHTALELFYNDNNFYPANLPGGTKLGVDVKQMSKEGFGNSNFLYMGLVPADPRTPEQDYFYYNCNNDFVIKFHLDINFNGVNSGINYSSKEGITSDLSNDLINCIN